MNDTLLGILLSLIPISLIIYSYFFERTRLRVVEYEIAGLPEDIIVISDLHMKREERFHRRLGALISASPIKTLFCLGDTFENVADYPFFKCFDDKRCFFVLGNNDHGPGSTPERMKEILEIFERHSMKVLINEHRELFPGWTIAGVDDPHKFRDDIDAAFKGIDKEEKCIFLSHSPEILDDIGEYSPFLLLYGHTHGGQIRIPLIGSIFNNIRRGKITKRGISTYKGVQILHTWGLGTTLFPLRFMSPPELIILRSKRI